MRLLYFIFALAALPATLSLSIDFVDKGSMPFSPRAHMSTVVVGTKVYFFGGLTSTVVEQFDGSDEVYSYDTTTDSWEQLANYTFPLYGICSATDGETIWTFGGYNSDQPADWRGKYNIGSNSWEFAELPRYVYECSAAYVPETGNVLVMYGRAPAYVYNPTTDELTDVSSSFPGSEALDIAAGSVFYDNQLWLAGGNADVTKFVTVSADGTTWTTKASNVNGTSYIDAIQIGEVMLTFGGSDMGHEQAIGHTRVNMYNITSDEWTTLPVELPLPLNGAAATLAGPSIYLFGGVYYNDQNEYTLTNKYWVVPCVDPSVCEYGCDSQSGKCNLPPVAPVSTAPTQPATQSPSSSAPTGSKTPQAKSSSSVAKNVSPILAALVFLLFVLA